MGRQDSPGLARQRRRLGQHSQRHPPPQSGNPRYNLHADDIDFQIESDVFGMIAPGMPQVSNRFDDRMGQIMNYGDGVYGGMFISAMHTQALFAKSIRGSC
jgi:hypothetical protein